MSAETKQTTQDAYPSPLLPPSSPIDGFGSPSLLALPPPADRTRRSQSSNEPPRLQLASSSTVGQDISTRSGSILPAQPQAVEEEEVDELDEFDDQMPAELDLAVCDMLEAESLRTATQRREQADLAICNSTTTSFRTSAGTSSGSGTSSSGSTQKRCRPSPVRGEITEIIDLREASPAPSSSQSPNKRAKQSPKPRNDGDPITPYFREDRVRAILARCKGPRTPSPPEPLHLTNARSSQLQPSPSAVQPIVIDTSTKRKSASQPFAGKLGTSSIQTSRKNKGNSSGSSDDDVPLAAALRGSLKAFNPSSSAVLTALYNADKAVAELKETYAQEMQRVQAALVERDVLIDRMRATIRKKGSK